jgi:hypothetical protein
MPPAVTASISVAVERGPISKWKTDRPGMGHKLPRLKSGVPAGGYRRESLCIAPFLIRSQGRLQAWASSANRFVFCDTDYAGNRSLQDSYFGPLFFFSIFNWIH